MTRITPVNVLLFAVHVLIGGWAFWKMITPANLLNVIRLFSFC